MATEGLTVACRDLVRRMGVGEVCHSCLQIAVVEGEVARQRSGTIVVVDAASKIHLSAQARKGKINMCLEVKHASSEEPRRKWTSRSRSTLVAAGETVVNAVPGRC